MTNAVVENVKMRNGMAGNQIILYSLKGYYFYSWWIEETIGRATCKDNQSSELCGHVITTDILIVMYFRLQVAVNCGKYAQNSI